MFHYEKDKQGRNEQVANPKKVNRRRFLRRGSFIAGLTAFGSAFSLTPFSPAYAAEKSVQEVPTAQILQDDQASQYTQKVILSPSYQKFKQKLHQTYAGKLVIEEQNVVASLITFQQNKFVSVRIPIQGGAGYSSYTEILEWGSHNVMMMQSAIFVHVDSHNIRCVRESDGKVVFDAIVTLHGDVVKGVAQIGNDMKAIDGLTSRQMLTQVVPLKGCSFFGCFGDCWDNQGLPGWAIAGLSVLCGPACKYLEVTCGPCVLTALAAFSILSGYCYGNCVHCIGS
jgi:hypothetical protein